MKSENGLSAIMPDDHPGVLLVTIDRPPVNAITLALFKEIRELFRTLAERTDVRCVVLTAAGRLFTAGADTKELAERTTEIQIARSVVSRETFDSIRRCPIPVIGAINGGALGAGVVIASCCDLLVASENASFSLPEVKVGVLGGTRHTRRLMPDKVMRYIALTGRSIDARFLERFGGIHAVVPPDQLLDAAYELADDIAQKSPATVRLMKEAINLTEDMPVTEGYRVEQLFTTISSGLEESKEASRAIMEKRPPSWLTPKA